MYKQNAYLIMAHRDFEILKNILIILDDDDADFFVHVDLKANDFNSKEFENCVKKSNLTFIDSMDIQWGDRSQIDLEIKLLKKATEKKYDYYHLISGVDFPLKKPSEINYFFKINTGKNYIDFDDNSNIDRLKYYYWFQRKIGKKKNFLYYLQKTSIIIQKVFRINRIKGKECAIYKGANWFSITYDLANYIVSNFSEYSKLFDYTICADEIFLQTIAMSSPYKDTIVKDCMREIDWKRGDPYIFRSEDYNMLTNSNKLFARKFDTEVDKHIIEDLFSYLSD